MLKFRTLALDDHYNTQQSLVFGHCDLDLTQHAAHVPRGQDLRGERVLCGPHRGSDSAEVFAGAEEIVLTSHHQPVAQTCSGTVREELRNGA